MQTFGHWTVIGQGENSKLLLCRCACGLEKDVYKSNLSSGKSSSCGCLNRPNPGTHNMTGKPEYYTWVQMKSRCSNPRNKGYQYYGRRGITVCERWKSSFEAFFEDMGPRPSSKHSIERNETNGNYKPSNCRWATKKEQMRNRSDNLNLEIDGVTKTAAEWAEVSGIPVKLLYARIALGIDPKRAISTRKRLKRSDAGKKRSVTIAG